MIRKLAIVVFALSMSVPLAYGQNRGQRSPRADDFTIRGKIVFDTPHPPSERIEVRLEKGGGQLINTAFSDSVGNFLFNRLIPDVYYVIVEVDGYEPHRERVELSSSFMRQANVSLFLKSKTVITRRAPRGFEGEDPNVIDITQLRTNYPKKAVQEYEKALKDAEKGNVKKAAERLEKALEEAPDFYQARNNLGVQYHRLGRYRDAERTFHMAIEINPRAAQPLINLGSMHLEEGESLNTEGLADEAVMSFQKAVDSLEQAVVLDATSSSAHYYLGSALYKTERMEQAESMLVRSLELDEDLHAVRLMLVNVFMKQGRYEEVLDQLSIYLERNPDGAQRQAVEAMKEQIEKALNQ